MTGKQRELLHEIDRLTIDLVDTIAKLSNRSKPENYSEIIMNLRDFTVEEIDKENGDDSLDELEYPF